MEVVCVEWYIKVVKNYVGFQGRARRKEYWMFYLFNFIFSFVLGFIKGFTGFSLLLNLYTIALLLPSLAVTVRRLHDIGKSGWWILIGFIPVVGQIILIILNCQDSEKRENQYGPNPKTAI
nr:DUF805 domain-containing protein [Bacillus haynesii]